MADKEGATDGDDPKARPPAWLLDANNRLPLDAPADPGDRKSRAFRIQKAASWAPSGEIAEDANAEDATNEVMTRLLLETPDDKRALLPPIAASPPSSPRDDEAVAKPLVTKEGATDAADSDEEVAPTQCTECSATVGGGTPFYKCACGARSCAKKCYDFKGRRCSACNRHKQR